MLSPLSSVINYAPYTEQTLKQVIADRLWDWLATRGVFAVRSDFQACGPRPPQDTLLG